MELLKELRGPCFLLEVGSLDMEVHWKEGILHVDCGKTKNCPEREG